MKHLYKGKERREFSRYKVDFPLLIRGADFKIPAQVKDISCKGVFCQTQEFIPLKTKLEVVMDLSLAENRKRIQKYLICPAEVARIKPETKYSEYTSGDYEVGIAFSLLSKEEKDLILRFVRQKNFKDAKTLSKMYLELKNLVRRLMQLEESHPTAKHFSRVIHRAIEELDSVSQILDSEIDELKTLS
ncbi:MAG: PilZ domain-containing protein [Candidatus Omnitrophota bacterium]